MRQRLLMAALVFGIGVALLPVSIALGAPPANQDFQSTWARTDRPVAGQEVNRTWMWGPEAFTEALSEPYQEAPDGQRTVQYYDKSRMEITDPNADPASVWYVTNGLLATELVTGQLQTGDNTFEQYDPAQINVAGDAGDPDAPTYATMGMLLDTPPLGDAVLISGRLDRSGNVTDDPATFNQYEVSPAYLVPETNHQVASPFWEFMNSTGLVYQDGAYQDAQIFQDPFFATGFPITEAYWTTVQVGGEDTDVLVQCFERRCLTYTPGNEAGWRVESGNVGRHYYEWRYNQIDQSDPSPVPAATTGDVRIVDILADPVDFGESEGEWVDILNFAGEPIDMTGWRLEDAAENSFTFPEFTLGIDAAVRIHICDGENSATDLYWGRCSGTWNNSGDTARLYDSAGNLISEYSY